MTSLSVVSFRKRYRPARVVPLFLASVLCVLMLGFRMYLSGNTTFLFLVWNLFLAWIPFLISHYLVNLSKPKWWQIGILSSIWLLFLPNAPYIITDLFHFKLRAGIPRWMDLVVLISFAWTGLILGLASLRQMQERFFDRLGKWWSQIVLIAIQFLVSFGVYLGREERWNSWDLWQKPDQLLTNIWQLLSHPRIHDGVYGFTFFFGLLLIIAFYTYAKRPHHS
ncbi:MAG: DUF1361 domain-containing protein [Bacteroidota bacterium]